MMVTVLLSGKLEGFVEPRSCDPALAATLLVRGRVWGARHSRREVGPAVTSEVELVVPPGPPLLGSNPLGPPSDGTGDVELVGALLLVAVVSPGEGGGGGSGSHRTGDLRINRAATGAIEGPVGVGSRAGTGRWGTAVVPGVV